VNIDTVADFVSVVTTFSQMNQLILSYIIAALLTAAAVGIEHLAFRTPTWAGRELARRAIGDSTVLGIYFVVPVLFGGADFVTWAGVVGLFAIAAGVKLAMAWRDGMRRAELVGRLNGDETAD
jgi:hypothetical protein